MTRSHANASEKPPPATTTLDAGNNRFWQPAKRRHTAVEGVNHLVDEAGQIGAVRVHGDDIAATAKRTPGTAQNDHPRRWQSRNRVNCTTHFN